jgi:hypothetical protein
MKDVTIRVIPHNQQRYNTLGDWIPQSDGSLIIYVSDTGTDYYNHLIALHEYVEALLCEKNGIKEQDVMEFDLKFEKELHPMDADPGDDPRAPYYKEHQIATEIEDLILAGMGEDGVDYSVECLETLEQWEKTE